MQFWWRVICCNLLQFAAVCCDLLGRASNFLSGTKILLQSSQVAFSLSPPFFSKSFVCDLSGGQIDFKQYISYFDGLQMKAVEENLVIRTRYTAASYLRARHF